MKAVYQNLPLAFNDEVAPSPRPLPESLQVKPEWQPTRRESLNGNYELGYELGKGASGSVVLAEDKRTGRYVAIKLMSKQGLQNDQLIRIRREYAIMRHMEHKNWIKLLDVIENPDQICLVMEYAACGDLYTHIVSAPNGKLAEKDAREIFIQAAEGIQYLHRCGFIHRDIKPENILLGKKNHVYIADLGYGTVWEKNKITNTPCGSLYYASPEIVRHDGVYVGPEVDVWSLGCVLYVMTTGRLPFHGSSSDSTRKLIIKGEFTVPYHISPELKHLICGMINIDPTKRFSMDTVMAHAWVLAGKGKSAPKRSLARRRSFGSSFATFVGGFSFGSKSKEILTENNEEPKQAKTKEGSKDNNKEKEKEKEKEEKKKKEKEHKPKTRGRSNSAATATIFEDAVPSYSPQKKSPKKSSSKDLSEKGEEEHKKHKENDSKEKEKEKVKEKKGSGKKKRRNSFNFGKLTAILEEGVMVEEKEEPEEPGGSKGSKRSPGRESGDEKEKDTKKKKKALTKKMTSSWGGEVWGLPAIVEEDGGAKSPTVPPPGTSAESRKITF